MRIKPVVFLLIFCSFFLAVFTACQPNQASDSPLRIAISKAGPGSSYKNYTNWLHHADSSLVFFNMYTLPLDSALLVLESCQGLLLTGGPDVYPAWYGQEGDTAKCGVFDRRRDTLEFRLIEKALSMDIPILGICRGEQIFNISQGGSLVIDIPTCFDTGVVHRIVDDPYSCYHPVIITDTNSILHHISGAFEGHVTSNHHQAVDRLAENLKIVAYSADSLPEAVEWEDPSEKPFFLAVQWHPERMKTDNPLSLPLAYSFLESAREYQRILSK